MLLPPPVAHFDLNSSSSSSMSGMVVGMMRGRGVAFGLMWMCGELAKP